MMAVAFRQTCFLCGKVSRTNASQVFLQRLASTASFKVAAVAGQQSDVPRRCASTNASFKFADLEERLAKPSQLSPKPPVDKLQFGKTLADHMLEIEWTDKEGWGTPLISPVHNLVVHPSAKVFHYAVELFEGLKAFRGVDGKVRIFRGDMNMARMYRTAQRSSLPTFDQDELLKCIRRLVQIDQDWVPQSMSSSMYIRPTLIGTEPALGISKSLSALLYVLIGPTGPYFATGLKPVSLLADPEYVRAWPKGCGDKKMGANYAPTIRIQEIAESQGLQQVLWLFGDDHQLTEVGSMNIMVFIINDLGEKELITPPLDGLILPGVTRFSLLELARQWGEFKVTERKITMKEIVRLSKEKRLLEMFGAGTACVVCPVSSILYYGETINIPTMDHDQPLNQRLLHALADIQYGKVKHPWAVEID